MDRDTLSTRFRTPFVLKNEEMVFLDKYIMECLKSKADAATNWFYRNDIDLSEVIPLEKIRMDQIKGTDSFTYFYKDNESLSYQHVESPWKNAEEFRKRAEEASKYLGIDHFPFIKPRSKVHHV